MNNIKIAIKHKTNLTLELEKNYNITYYKKRTFIQKLFFIKEQYPDIYFHKGTVTKEASNLIENAKKVIVNSQVVKDSIENKFSMSDKNKIEVIYPYYHSNIIYDKKIKKEFKLKHQISKESKIIFIRGVDIKKSGLQVLFEAISRMYEDNFTLVIESSVKQIGSLRLHMRSNKPTFKYILFEDYKNKEELFISSDIFILPTQQKYFSIDVLRAMYYKNAVFIMQSNDASEVVDVFSQIQGSEDRSISFKIDSLLTNNNELKKIQKENKKIVQKFTLDKTFKKIEKIINESFDI